MRGQKGITLVALIITIVVLMILAGVAISSIQGENGILGYARNSATVWNKATQNEATTVQEYLDYLKENTCEHNWSNGKCTKCGSSCNHEFVDGKCTKCALTCDHSKYWSNGKCTRCALICDHSAGTIERLSASSGGRTHYYYTYCKVCNKVDKTKTRSENCVIDGKEYGVDNYYPEDGETCDICDGES